MRQRGSEQTVTSQTALYFLSTVSTTKSLSGKRRGVHHVTVISARRTIQCRVLVDRGIGIGFRDTRGPAKHGAVLSSCASETPSRTPGAAACPDFPGYSVVPAFRARERTA